MIPGGSSSNEIPNNDSSKNEIKSNDPPSTSAKIVTIFQNKSEKKDEDKNLTSAHQEIDLEKIFIEMGPAGKFQLRNFSLILVSTIVMAMYNGQYIFNAAKPKNQRCMVPECENTPSVFETGEWKTWAIPDDPQKARCFRYANQEGQCKKESFSKVLMKCDSWLYEDYNSIVAEFDLGCHEWKRTLVGTIHGLGLMTALAFIGTLSDLCGRRYTFIVTSSLPSVLGIVRGLSNSYYMYLAFEYLEALVASGSYSTGYILAVEMIGVEKRVFAASCLSCSFAIGQILLAFFAWILPYWRNLTFLLYTPGILFVTYYFCLVESVRWLMSQGRKKEAADIIFKGAAVNKRTLPPDTIAYLETMSSVVPIKTKKKSIMTETKIIFRSRILITRLIVISFWFTAVSFIYYGLSINAVSLAGNKYVNYALLSVIEIPGYIINIFTLDYFGRKKTITTSYLITAIALTIMPFIINIGGIPVITVLIAKMFISTVFSATYLYVTELTPTEVRHTMMGLSLFIGRLGKSCAPLSPLLLLFFLLPKDIVAIDSFCQTPVFINLLQVTPYLPYVVFGAAAWIAAALTHWTPETHNMKMPETLQEAEHLEIGASFLALQERQLSSTKHKETAEHKQS